MKKGDIVRVHDFSYSRSVENGGLCNNFHAFHPDCRDDFVIVETDCKFPRTSSWQDDNNYNDTVIQSIKSGLVVMIEQRFLKEARPKHEIIIDVASDGCCVAFGKPVKISDELYQKIKQEVADEHRN